MGSPMNSEKPHCSDDQKSPSSPKTSSRLAHPIDTRVGKKIRALRQARNLSQTALAEKIGVTFQQVQKYERGSNRVGAARLHAIAAALDVDVQTFVSDLPQTGESNSQALARAAFAASPEGVRLLDMFRALPPHPRRMALGVVAAVIGCFRNGPDGCKPAELDFSSL
jgi:transcriptional regulator with XRE-family HTH domain